MDVEVPEPVPPKPVPKVQGFVVAVFVAGVAFVPKPLIPRRKELRFEFEREPVGVRKVTDIEVLDREVARGWLGGTSDGKDRHRQALA